MAYQRMIFLVALALTVALGCHGGRICHTNRDCPACKVGRPLCADGLCTCLDMKTNNDGRICHRNKDCPPCKLGKPLCAVGLCICTDIKTDDDDDDDVAHRSCKVDNDCAKLCKPGCHSYNCINKICFCQC